MTPTIRSQSSKSLKTMALALARKYRPKNFSEVAVQNHVSDTLRGAIARNRVAHGYLFCGPRGTGKTTLARVLAMALNCQHKTGDGEPCGECQNCTRIWSGSSSLDVIEIDAASNRGVDDARELRERAMYAPSGDDRYKVYIVDEAHMLTREAWNALLKILEEPPPRVIFAFATTEPEKIAQAAAPVLSRLQRFDLKRIGPVDIIKRLTAILELEQVSATPEALSMIARAADGSMRDSLSLTDQVISVGDGVVTAEAVRDALGLIPEDEYLTVLDLIADGRAGDIFAAVQRLSDNGVDFGTFLTGFTDILRSQLSVLLGGGGLDVSEPAVERLKGNVSKFSIGDLVRMLNAVSEIEPRFKKSGQQQLLIELSLVRFALMDRTLTLDQVLNGLAAGAGAESGGGGNFSSRGGGEFSSRGGGASGVNSSGMSASGNVDHADWRSALNHALANPPVESGSPARSGPVSSGRDSLSPVSEAAPPHASGAVSVSDDAARAPGGMERSPVRPAEQRTSSPPRTEEEPPHPADSPFSSPSPQSSFSGDVRAAKRSAMDTMRQALAQADSGKAPTRLTDEQIKTERVDVMRSKDPMLGEVIDALDLELMD